MNRPTPPLSRQPLTSFAGFQLPLMSNVTTHMRKLTLSLLLSFFSSLGFAQNSAQIKIDDEHLQMQRADGKSPRIYVLPSAQSLDLDSSSYKFNIPASLNGRSPNSIQLVLEKTEQYSAPWRQDSERHLLSDKSLTPNPGSVRFKGLRSGQEGVVAVGYMEGNQFSVIWVGLFKVQ